MLSNTRGLVIFFCVDKVSETSLWEGNSKYEKGKQEEHVDKM